MINARSFAENGSAIVIENKQLEAVDLLEKAVELFESGQAEKMSKAASASVAENTQPAVDKIVDEILELIKIKKGETVAEHRGGSNQV
jgi:UDP-N-acetylglucosamine:LPS N-acetylglucosamine transferase